MPAWFSARPAGSTQVTVSSPFALKCGEEGHPTNNGSQRSSRFEIEGASGDVGGVAHRVEVAPVYPARSAGAASASRKARPRKT